MASNQNLTVFPCVGEKSVRLKSWILRGMICLIAGSLGVLLVRSAIRMDALSAKLMTGGCGIVSLGAVLLAITANASRMMYALNDSVLLIYNGRMSYAIPYAWVRGIEIMRYDDVVNGDLRMGGEHWIFKPLGPKDPILFSNFEHLKHGKIFLALARAEKLVKILIEANDPEVDMKALFVSPENPTHFVRALNFRMAQAM